VLIRIPAQLASAIDEEPERRGWLARLPAVVEEAASAWQLELGEPYEPGGQCAWVAPARDRAGAELALKVGWRHPEAELEADGLRFWDGDGAVRCFRDLSAADTSVLLLERCVPGATLKNSMLEPEQDVVLAGLMRCLWARQLPDGHPFAPLTQICELWAEEFETAYAADDRGLDPGLARAGMKALRELPRAAKRSVLLCTDLHADNVLSSQRKSWLVIDPKPFVGDPAFEPVQHMLNCDERLATDPEGLCRRMAELLDLDAARVRGWLFARCAQESLGDLTMRELARRLAP
jgi:streptomycin 6-kinase